MTDADASAVSFSQIGMALAEAKKLFGASGGKTANGGNQQDVLNSAAGTLMKVRPVGRSPTGSSSS